MPPAVGDTPLAMTSSSSGTTCGSAAEREERKNLFTPSTSRAAAYRGRPRTPEPTRVAVSATKAALITADHTRIWRRDQRSMKTPANGPISEYGRYSDANAAAPCAGFGYVVALKNTYVPSPAVNTPSPACEISRVAKSLRKSRPARTVLR